MKSKFLIVTAGVAISLSYVGSSGAATNAVRREERRIERGMRGPTDRNTKDMLREEERLDEESGGVGQKYLKREQRAAAKEERRMEKLSSQVVKTKKHHGFTLPPS